MTTIRVDQPPPATQDNQQTPPAPPTSEPPTNPPAPPPPAPDPNATIGLYERLLQEQNAEIARLRAQAQAPAAPNNQPPAFNGENFFQNPGEVLDNFRKTLIQDVQQTISPLNQFRLQMERQTAYNNNKGQMEMYIPQHLKGYWPIIAQRMDMAFNAGYIQDASLQGLMGAFNTILGQVIAQGQVPVAPTNAIPPQPGVPFTPPSIPPSPPPPPTPPANQLRALTENEKLVARMAGMDDATYLKHLEGSTMIVQPQAAR